MFNELCEAHFVKKVFDHFQVKQSPKQHGVNFKSLFVIFKDLKKDIHVGLKMDCSHVFLSYGLTLSVPDTWQNCDSRLGVLPRSSEINTILGKFGKNSLKRKNLGNYHSSVTIIVF